MLVLVLVIFSFCLDFSQQDLLYKLALRQGLNFTEAESVREYERHGIKRQSPPFKSRSGIPQTKICGINGQSASRLKRQDIAAGHPQGTEDWPWMALFLEKSKSEWFCGGSLLNSRYVLTAAHCFANDLTKDKDNFYVRLGEFDIFENEETETQDFDVDKLIVHPEYDMSNQQNDIAVVKLNRTVEYTQFVRPICLPAFEPRPDEDAIVAGWGRTAEADDKSHLLLYVDVPVWDHDECVDAMSQPVHETNICAAPKTGGKDSCKGDSGGPLMYQGNDKRWENVGIVSWGLKCGEPYPAVYTSVPKFLRWIAKHILDASP